MSAIRWATVAAVTSVVTIGVSLGAAGPAVAHAELVTAEPAPGASVTTLGAVRLRFSEALRPEFSTMAVSGADGARVDSGASVTAGAQISVPVTVSAAGVYTVAYRVLSADGHPVEGSYAVTYAPPVDATAVPAASASPARPPTPSPEPEETAAPSTSTAADGNGNRGAAVWGGALAAVAAVAAAAGAGFVRHRRGRDNG